MYPKIKAGDIIVTYRNDDNKYQKGDVITFISEANGNINITHRVEQVYDVNDVYSYKTKGDNNNAADSEIIPSSNVLGKVIFKIPKAGYIQQFLVTRTGWIIAIVLPSMGIIIYDVLKVLKSAGKIGKKKTKAEIMAEESARKNLQKVIAGDSKKDFNTNFEPGLTFAKQDVGQTSTDHLNISKNYVNMNGSEPKDDTVDLAKFVPQEVNNDLYNKNIDKSNDFRDINIVSNEKTVSAPLKEVDDDEEIEIL